MGGRLPREESRRIKPVGPLVPRVKESVLFSLPGGDGGAGGVAGSGVAGGVDPAICQKSRLRYMSLVSITLTRLIFADGAPVAPGQQPFVVPRLVVYVVGKDGDHGFISIRIHVMDLVPLVQHVCYHVWRRRVDNGG